MKAANKNHPKACFMVANLILTNRVEGEYEFIGWSNNATKVESDLEFIAQYKLVVNDNQTDNSNVVVIILISTSIVVLLGAAGFIIIRRKKAN